MAITLDQIKDLRERSGVGINACKAALEESNGDMDKAMELLRKQGIAKSAKRAEKTAAEGVIGVYVHSNNKVVGLVVLNCETDFAAKSESFNTAAHDFAMQVAAMNPLYKDRASVPADVLEKEKEIFSAEIANENKPANIVEKILNGKVEAYYKENCLMEQDFFKDDSKTMQDYLNEIIAKIGEKIEVNRFFRMSM